MSAQLQLAGPAPAQQFAVGEVRQMADAVAASGLFGIRNKEQALTLLLLAQADGVHPMTALRVYHVIDGKPAMKAEAMLAGFQARGGKAEWHHYGDDAADVTFSHPAGGSVRVRWDQPRAERAGLWGRGQWTKYPAAMLRSRAISEGIRTVLPAVVSGFYTPEEVSDFDARPVAQAETSLHPATEERPRDVRSVVQPAPRLGAASEPQPEVRSGGRSEEPPAAAPVAEDAGPAVLPDAAPAPKKYPLTLGQEGTGLVGGRYVRNVVERTDKAKREKWWGVETCNGEQRDIREFVIRDKALADQARAYGEAWTRLRLMVTPTRTGASEIVEIWDEKADEIPGVEVVKEPVTAEEIP